MATSPKAPPARVTQATLAALKVAGKRDAARLALRLLEQDMATLLARKALLERVLSPENLSAWCADLTEDASGDVATLDIPDEGALALIAPAAPPPGPDDGRLTTREAMSGPQAYWCAAALPGLQKWRPQYRRGTITALDAAHDLANVALDADPSSAQGLGINQASDLEDVPVQYMTCHAQAFEVGDRCVVKFTDRDWAQPKVVGFESHPKSCGYGVHLIFCQPSLTDNGATYFPPLITGGMAPTKYELRASGQYFMVRTDAPECSRYILSSQVIYDTKYQLTGSTSGPPFPTTLTQRFVTYELLSFFGNKPVLLRKQSSRDFWTDSYKYTDDQADIQKLTWGTATLSTGSRTMYGYRLVVGASYSTETYNNYLFNWSKWAAVIGETITGTKNYKSSFNGVPGYLTGSFVTSKFWAALSSSPKAAQEAQVPPMGGVAIPYPTPGYPTGPGLNRHDLDFFHRPVTFLANTVIACCKNVFFTRYEANPASPLSIYRYDMGPLVYSSFYVAAMYGADTHNVFFDDYIASISPGTDGFGFRMVIYGLDGVPVKKVTTDAAPPVGYTQVVIAGLPAIARLVGAMRDEVACM